LKDVRAPENEQKSESTQEQHRQTDDIAQNFVFESAPMAFAGVNEKDEVFAGMSVAKVVDTLKTNVKTVRPFFYLHSSCCFSQW
jgi:hypothetical protein